MKQFIIICFCNCLEPSTFNYVHWIHHIHAGKATISTVSWVMNQENSCLLCSEETAMSYLRKFPLIGYNQPRRAQCRWVLLVWKILLCGILRDKGDMTHTNLLFCFSRIIPSKLMIALSISSHFCIFCKKYLNNLLTLDLRATDIRFLLSARYGARHWGIRQISSWLHGNNIILEETGN